MSKRIDIDLDYITLDTAIEKLTILRAKYGGNATIDVGMESIPYETHEEVSITLIPKE